MRFLTLTLLTACAPSVADIETGNFRFSLSPTSTQYPDRTVDVTDPGASCDPGCYCSYVAMQVENGGDEYQVTPSVTLEGDYDELCPGRNVDLECFAAFTTDTNNGGGNCSEHIVDSPLNPPPVTATFLLQFTRE
jgi:hypothetical protein